MGNCCICKKQEKRRIILLLVGLDNAGKTVAVKALASENLEGSIPTIGFSVVNLNYSKYQISIYDLGGRQDIRGIWHRYFVDAHGVIFVVDASDFSRFDEAKNVLTELLSHEKIAGKPLLILANKQDNQEALDEIDLVEKLDLERLVNEKRCPTLVESCTAKESTKKIDPGIEKGYQWLLNYIIKDYDVLNKRVEVDMATQKQIDDQVRKERMERIKINQTSETSEEEEIINSNPFKPIHELVNGKTNMINNFKSPSHSIKSTNSCVYFNRQNSLKTPERPKSAVQIVKDHLEKSNKRSIFTVKTNKTSPLQLLSPKSAPIFKSEHSQEYETTFRSSSQTGQILTVTELPNAIIDANGENIGDLFELNNFSTNRKLPPLRQKPVDDFSWINKPKNVIQNNIDEIYKDIS